MATSSPLEKDRLENFRRQNYSSNWIIYLQLGPKHGIKGSEETCYRKGPPRQTKVSKYEFTSKLKEVSEVDVSQGEQEEPKCWSSLKNIATKIDWQHLTPLEVWKHAVKHSSPSALYHPCASFKVHATWQWWKERGMPSELLDGEPCYAKPNPAIPLFCQEPWSERRRRLWAWTASSQPGEITEADLCICPAQLYHHTARSGTFYPSIQLRVMREARAACLELKANTRPAEMQKPFAHGERAAWQKANPGNQRLALLPWKRQHREALWLRL